MKAADKVLHSSLAGTWYVADPEVLRREIESYFPRKGRQSSVSVAALLLPHAGYCYSARTAAAALQTVRGRKYARVVILGPSHCVYLPGFCSLPDATHIETPLGRVPLDTCAMERLLRHDCFHQMPSAHEQEHSVQIQLPLLQTALAPGFKAVPVVVGDLNAGDITKVAAALREVLDGDSLLVISSDFTHYGASFGFRPFRDEIPDRLAELDLGAYEFIERKDSKGFMDYVLRTGATICGRLPIAVMLELLRPEMKVRRADYARSGEITGEWEHCVSYLSAIVEGAW